MILPGLPMPLAMQAGAAAFRSITSVSNAIGDQTLSAPAGQKAGDLLLVIFACQTLRPADTPSGWTKISSWDGSSSSFYVFWKIASMDGESVRVYTPSGTGNRTIFYACFSGATGLDAGSVTTVTNGNNSITIAAVTAAKAGIRLATGFVDINTATVTSPPSGMAEILVAEGSVLGLGLWMAEGSPAGASPTAGITWSETNDKAGVQLQVY